MNIKGLNYIIGAAPVIKKERQKLQSFQSQRDRDSQNSGYGRQQPQRRLSDEEVEKLLDNLRKLEGVQDNDLVVELISSQSSRQIIIKDHEDNVVRRIPESDFLALLNQTLATSQSKGTFFDRQG